jgi:colanic acid biosynthesis glycosyl transferase WcaI
VRANPDLGGEPRSPQIVFVNRYFFPDQSATSRILSDLAFRLAASGVSVAVVTSRQLYENSRAALPARETLGAVRVYRVLTATRGRSRTLGRALDYASFHCAAGLQLLKILSRGDVVVAKTDPPLISIVASLAAKWRGAVLVNWLQDLFPEVASALAPDLMPKWLEGQLVAARDRSLRRAAINVVLANGMRERLLSRGIHDSRVRIVPNWTDAASITPMPPEESKTRQRLALSRRFVIGYSGNLGRGHEFDTLIGAARLLCQDPSFAFLMTGAGAKSGGLRRAVEAERLDNFVFQDYQPPEVLSDSLAAADVHLVSLLPALEGLIVPSKMYGILAAGRPAIFIGDTDGDLARMIREHDCGIAIAVGDSKRLAVELRALRDDRTRLESMGTNARQLALARYTSEHAVADWLALLGVVAPSTVRWTQRTLSHARYT